MVIFSESWAEREEAGRRDAQQGFWPDSKLENDTAYQSGFRTEQEIKERENR